MSPISRKPAFEKAKPLADFLQRTLAEYGVTVKAAADAIGISQSHLSDIINLKKVPDAGVCNDIADFYALPKILILGLAGWIDLEREAQIVQLWADEVVMRQVFSELTGTKDTSEEMVGTPEMRLFWGAIGDILKQWYLMHPEPPSLQRSVQHDYLRTRLDSPEEFPVAKLRQEIMSERVHFADLIQNRQKLPVMPNLQPSDIPPEPKQEDWFPSNWGAAPKRSRKKTKPATETQDFMDLVKDDGTENN